MKQSPVQLYEKLQRLEKELNQLKVEAYLRLPPQKQALLYSQQDIQNTLNKTRKDIWDRRYAKNIKGIS